MFVRKGKYQEVRDALTLALDMMDKQYKELVELKGQLSRKEIALNKYREDRRKAENPPLNISKFYE